MKRQEPVGEALVEGAVKPTPWAKVRERLENPRADQTYWLATVRPGGQPHVMPLIGLWIDDGFYFITGRQTRKARNLSHDQRCVVTAGSKKLPSIDIVMEGAAKRVANRPQLTRVAEAYRKMGWPLKVRGAALVGPNAPTAGPPPYTVYKVKPDTVFGLPGLAGMQRGSITPTKWRFVGTAGGSDRRHKRPATSSA